MCSPDTRNVESRFRGDKGESAEDRPCRTAGGEEIVPPSGHPDGGRPDRGGGSGDSTVREIGGFRFSGSGESCEIRAARKAVINALGGRGGCRVRRGLAWRGGRHEQYVPKLR